MALNFDPAKTPALPAPPGYSSNLVHPECIGHQVIEISLPCTILATFFVLLRLYTRGYIVRSIGSDDGEFLMPLSVLSWIFAILGIINLQYGYGCHVWDISLSKVRPFLIVDLLGQDFYFAGTCLVKVSILLFFIRLNPDKLFHGIAYTIMSLVCVYSFIGIIIATFGCTPIEGGWDLTVPSKCVDKKAFYYFAAVMNILTDFATLTLPVKMCLELQVNRKMKVLLLGLFVIASFASVVSIVRLATMVPSLSSIDFTRFKVGVAGWAAIEINVGIICACLPCLRPMIRKHFPALLETGASEQPPKSIGKSIQDNLKRSKVSARKGTEKLDESEIGWDGETRHELNVLPGDDKTRSESITRILTEDNSLTGAKATEYDVSYHSGDSKSFGTRSVHTNH
ncbi:hypothetical protein M501DRAFT_978337 [Patellaria atrata CBS 101060]|uniref:Rhodopsin domain-containing protein n=1 Tax=Patellaria atrata CBS 101060 TaxID=1346257 RepID=A0A9P4S6Y7_9PEZI|nr:hypothetical protein M501DRAFT_978337 [Patellaria atrata CBS 101060]